MFATAESLSPYKHKINISGENRVGRTAGTKEVWSKSCCHPSWFTVAAGFVTTCHHLSHLESCRSWCYWCCWCCPPARCYSWGSLACGASRPMTDFPGRGSDGQTDTWIHLFCWFYLTWTTAEYTTNHAGVVVLCGLCLVLLYHAGEAAGVGGGAGEVMTFRDGRSPATEIRTTQPYLISIYIYTAIKHDANPIVCCNTAVIFLCTHLFLVVGSTSGELWLDELSDLGSCETWPLSGVFWVFGEFSLLHKLGTRWHDKAKING